MANAQATSDTPPLYPPSAKFHTNYNIPIFDGDRTSWHSWIRTFRRACTQHGMDREGNGLWQHVFGTDTAPIDDAQVEQMRVEGTPGTPEHQSVGNAAARAAALRRWNHHRYRNRHLATLVAQCLHPSLSLRYITDDTEFDGRLIIYGCEESFF